MWTTQVKRRQWIIKNDMGFKQNNINGKTTKVKATKLKMATGKAPPKAKFVNRMPSDKFEQNFRI